MLLPLMFVCPAAFWTLRQAAVARHVMCGVYGTRWDEQSMRMVYVF